MQSLKELPKHSGIKINGVFMQYFENIKMNAEHSIMSKMPTLEIKAGSLLPIFPFPPGSSMARHHAVDLVRGPKG